MEGDRIVPAEWYEDPTQRHQLRYWDGAQWTDNVADDGTTAIDPIDGAATPGEGPEHAVVLLINQATGGSTQYILTDITRADLEEAMLGSQLAVMLDVRSAEQVDELLVQGRTQTSGAMGQRQTVTITWCTCDDPGSHRRAGAAQLGA
ncbi:MAG: DUF2510 domain-containing protein [Coriobacteriia bacterium]